MRLKPERNQRRQPIRKAQTKKIRQMNTIPTRSVPFGEGMAHAMRCIVGLGNPEPRYTLTRHNIGFQIADKLAQSQGITFKKGKGEFLFARGIIGDENVLLVKPVTYMNRSGIAVQQILHYYKIPMDNIIIVLDDIDLPFGTFRMRPCGGSAGNRGMKSIVQHVGSEEIPRFRFGIRNRKKIANPSAYVLSNFTRRERMHLPDLLTTAEKAVSAWVTEGIDRSMNRYNANHIVQTD